MVIERSRPTNARHIVARMVATAVRRTVFTARLLDQLNSGKSRFVVDSALKRWLRSPQLRSLLALLELIQDLDLTLFPRRRIHANKLTQIPANQLLGSPYQRCERLAYLRDIDGVVCASNCFRDSFHLARKRSNQTLQIDLNGFDGFITTSPLNLQPLNTPLFLQTVHDLIPLEYGRTLDHIPSFSSRLLATTNARRIYVSEDAKQKIQRQPAFGRHQHISRYPNAGADPTPLTAIPWRCPRLGGA